MADRDNTSGFGDREPGDFISDFDRRVYEALDKGGQFFGKDFKQYIVEWLTINQPLVPVGLLLGFSGYTINAANVVTFETTTSTSYAALSTAGPSLTELPPGQYFVQLGAAANTSDANSDSWMSVSVNGAAATDGHGSRSSTESISGLTQAFTVTLPETSNSLVCMYRTDPGPATAGFTNRWLSALKFANL